MSKKNRSKRNPKPATAKNSTVPVKATASAATTPEKKPEELVKTTTPFVKS